MRNLLIFTTILLSTSVLVGCSKRHVVIDESVTTETTTNQLGHRVKTIRRIPSGALIRITDLEKVENEGSVIMGALKSPLPAVGRRAKHNIGLGQTLTLSDVWWEPRSAYAQSDLVQNEINLAKARWHEKEDISAED